MEKQLNKQDILSFQQDNYEKYATGFRAVYNFDEATKLLNDNHIPLDKLNIVKNCSTSLWIIGNESFTPIHSLEPAFIRLANPISVFNKREKDLSQDIEEKNYLSYFYKLLSYSPEFYSLQWDKYKYLIPEEDQKEIMERNGFKSVADESTTSPD